MIYNNEKVYDIEQLINSLEIGMRMPVQLKRKDGVILVEKDRIITERIIDHLIRIKSQIEHIQLDDMDSKDADDLLNIGRKPKETVNVESIKEVACFSILLAKRYNDRQKVLNPKISKDVLINLEDVAMAAVLQDIGKICENGEELKKIQTISNSSDSSIW